MKTEIYSKTFRINQLPALSKRQIESASLPLLYLEAKQALMELDRIDEIKEIADKHSAIAHYAKQVKDQSLKFYAERIYFRAMRRIGEILESLSPEGRKEKQKNLSLTNNQVVDARKAARVEKKKFEEMVERTPPASKNEIFAAGSRQISQEQKNNKWNNYLRENYTPGQIIKTTLEDIEESILIERMFWSSELNQELRGNLFQLCSRISQEDAFLISVKVRKLAEFIDDIDRLLDHRKATVKQHS